MSSLSYRLFATALLTATLGGCGPSDVAQPGGRQSNDASKSATASIQPAEQLPQKKPNEFARIPVKHLENVYRVHSKVLSGGEPMGQAGFEALAKLGVKTIISVDGATPDIDRARQHGMRYVHLPHGYDGVPEERVKELAKAVRDLEGPIYIHCHHGKHRSPAAAAVACVGAGFIGTADALALLTTAGTSTNYRGLYQSAEQARRFEDALLDALEAEFREVVPVPPLADAMVALERAHDHILQIAAARWRPLPEHPDLDPAHEALLLREHYTELLRTDEVKRRPAEFQAHLRQGEHAAESLEQALDLLGERKYPADEPRLHQTANKALAAINRNCAACHAQFRDVPLSEK